MIKGSVNAALEATVRLTVQGPHGKRQRISAVIDTGYNGALTLPPDVIAELELPWSNTVPVMLGDGSICECDIYVGTVVWDRKPIHILIDEANTTPLVGMKLLRGFELNMKVQRRGEVTIKTLRRRRGG